jgi:hypothetical protein
MRVHQWYTQTYFYKKALALDVDGSTAFEQEGGTDKVYSEQCRAEHNNYAKSAWHRDDEQPNTKISSQIQHRSRDYVCCPDDDPTDANSFKRIRDIRIVRDKAGRLVQYILLV